MEETIRRNLYVKYWVKQENTQFLKEEKECLGWLESENDVKRISKLSKAWIEANLDARIDHYEFCIVEKREKTIIPHRTTTDIRIVIDSICDFSAAQESMKSRIKHAIADVVGPYKEKYGITNLTIDILDDVNGIEECSYPVACDPEK